MADEMRAAWRCPLAGYDEPGPESPPLASACEGALAAVHSLTGVRCPGTCPGWLVRQPWVHRAASARRWRDKGQLQLRLRVLTAAMVSAIDAIDAGWDACSAEVNRVEAERRKNPPPASPKAPTHE